MGSVVLRYRYKGASVSKPLNFGQFRAIMENKEGSARTIRALPSLFSSLFVGTGGAKLCPGRSLRRLARACSCPSSRVLATFRHQAHGVSLPYSTRALRVGGCLR